MSLQTKNLLVMKQLIETLMKTKDLCIITKGNMMVLMMVVKVGITKRKQMEMKNLMLAKRKKVRKELMIKIMLVKRKKVKNTNKNLYSQLLWLCLAA